MGIKNETTEEVVNEVSESIKYCPNCGNKVAEGTRFCTSCGKEL
ncbi:MAG: zinc ribbon domain-containing protein [Bacilli bacterium]|nr:zinc ribbon domain-containing protein [Bacilli bacterium]